MVDVVSVPLLHHMVNKNYTVLSENPEVFVWKPKTYFSVFDYVNQIKNGICVIWNHKYYLFQAYVLEGCMTFSMVFIPCDAKIQLCI